MWTEIGSNLLLFAAGYLSGKAGAWYRSLLRRREILRRLETLRLRGEILRELQGDGRIPGDWPAVPAFTHSERMNSLLVSSPHTSLENMDALCSRLEQAELEYLESIRSKLVNSSKNENR